MSLRGGTIGIAGGIVIAAVLVLTPLHQPWAEDTAPDTATDTANDFLQSVRDDEIPVLKASGGLAKRDGDTLFISHNGHPVASFTDRHSTCLDDPCERWTFLGTTNLQPSSGRPPLALAMIGFDAGAGGAFVVVEPSGDTVWFTGSIAASPDGRYIATGSNTSVHSPHVFRIVDWTSPGHTSAFDSPVACGPVATWQSAEVLVVRCGEGDSKYAVKVTRTPEGGWTMTESGEFADAFTYREKTIPHPRIYQMTPMHYDGSATAQLPPWQTVTGYRRL